MYRLSIWLTGLVVTLAMALLTAAVPPPVETLRNAVFDAYQRAAPRAFDPDVPVHVVDIDEASLKQLGQWPWPRTYLAEMTDRLFALGAAAVGFDVLFTEPDRTSPNVVLRDLQRFSPGAQELADALPASSNDARFAAAMRTRPVVVSIAGAQDGAVPAPKAGISFTGARPDSAITSYPGALAPLPVLAEAAAGLGGISLGTESDGISRSVPMVIRMGDRLVPSLSAELLRVAQGAGSHILKTSEASGEGSGGTARVVAMRTGRVSYPLDGNGRLRLHYARARPGLVTPAWQLLGGGDLADVRPEIAGRIVLVGSSAQGLFDLRATPLERQVPGVLLQAEVLEQILSGRFLTRPDWMPGLELVLLLLVGLSVTFLCTRDHPMAAVLGLAVLALGSGIGGWQAFAARGLLFDPSMVMLTGLLVLLPGSAIGLIGKEKMRQSIRSRFAYFVPEELVAQIAADPGRTLTPQGASREMTVMFVDMRKFSTVTEKMAPEDVVRFLNRYLGAVTDVMKAHGATIDKYIGDAIMAFWNAPLDQPGHRAMAVETIFGIIGAMETANRGLEAEGLPHVGIGIGINTGPAYVGLMGSRDRLSYTCIGDNVNQASRFEGLTRIYGTSNCVGADTVAGLPGRYRAMELDHVVVKGRHEPVALFTVFRATDAAMMRAAECFSVARTAYLARDWDRALAALERMEAAGTEGLDTALLAALYRDRIAQFRDVAPPPDWDGTFVATSKR